MTEPGKTTWRRALNRAQDFVTSPDTKRVAKVGNQILTVASHLGQAGLSGPLGIAGAAIGALDALANHAQLGSSHDAIAAITKRRRLRHIEADGAIALLYEQGHFSNATTLWTGEYNSLVAVELEDKMIAVVLEKTGGLASYWGAFISEDLAPDEVSSFLWKDFDTNYVVLSLKRTDRGRDVLSLAPLTGYDEIDYIGPNDPVAFVARFKRYLEAGISKAFLCVGPPGGGKTSFCFRLAQELGGRMMVITAELLDDKRMPHQDLVNLVATFKPSLLLFDDVDRVSNDGLLLGLMNFVRRAAPETLMMSTANDPKAIVPALRRPGRLGPWLMFPAPDAKLRQRLIRFFSEKFKIERDLTHLAEHMDHVNFSHDYVRDVVEQALVEEDDEALIQYIKQAIDNFVEDDKVKGKGKGIALPNLNAPIDVS